ncbi:MAG: DUF2116 family Zn-ribbon domain-containing protein [Bacteroidales bacterium]|nr:DUF2116 family Zn-ribbon domain-containing protein [Bacteroidales bacterium]
MEYKQTCLNCGNSLYGRSDKKFCSDECRNEYHNHHQTKKRRLRRSVIEALDRNHNCLEQLLTLGLTSVSLNELEELGFEKEVFTGIGKSVKNHSVFKCFDIEYALTPTRVMHIRHLESL